MWKNLSRNSAADLPVFFIYKKESDHKILNLIIPITDNARTNLNENGININHKKQNIHLHISIKDTAPWWR